MLGRKTPLKIFAPQPFDEILECHIRHYDLHLDYEIQLVEVRTRENEMIYRNNVMEVWTVPLRHRVPAAGFIFREKRAEAQCRQRCH